MALQAQINPHFLFNTLNAGMQLAIIEDAERTGSFLEDLSSLFRYNIQSLQNKVRLTDEFENARRYYELMRVRFGDQFNFTFELEVGVEDIEMPPLILQPIIENALIHGFRNKTENGTISIKAYSSFQGVTIDITDNGEGISQNDLDRLNTGDFRRMSDVGGHTTGLGLENVYERLRHFFDAPNIMRFDSRLEDFTKVTITLPRKDI
jgi:sensor histidine kinase YesM